MSSKNKQSKLRQTRNDEIEEESYLNYTTKIKNMFSVPCLCIFYQIILLKFLLSSSNLLLVCLLQS